MVLLFVYGPYIVNAFLRRFLKHAGGEGTPACEHLWNLMTKRRCYFFVFPICLFFIFFFLAVMHPIQTMSPEILSCSCISSVVKGGPTREMGGLDQHTRCLSFFGAFELSHELVGSLYLVMRCRGTPPSPRRLAEESSCTVGTGSCLLAYIIQIFFFGLFNFYASFHAAQFWSGVIIQIAA